MISTHQFIDLLMKGQVTPPEVEGLIQPQFGVAISLAEMINIRPFAVSQWDQRDFVHILRLGQIVDRHNIRHSTLLQWHIASSSVGSVSSACSALMMKHRVVWSDRHEETAAEISVIARRLRNEMEATLVRGGYDVKRQGVTIWATMVEGVPSFETALDIAIIAPITVTSS